MKLATLLLLGVLLAACSGGDDDDGITGISRTPLPDFTPTPTANERFAFPYPGSPAASIAAAGLPALSTEQLEYHIHAHLDIFVDGDAKLVPADIGIDNVVRVISPLHTHDLTGVIHVESAMPRSFTLGQFFAEWDVKLDENCVGQYCKPAMPIGVYVNGEQFNGNPATIEFVDLQEIAIVIGSPPIAIPRNYTGF
jgi:hypothetical protein